MSDGNNNWLQIPEETYSSDVDSSSAYSLTDESSQEENESVPNENNSMYNADEEAAQRETYNRATALLIELSSSIEPNLRSLEELQENLENRVQTAIRGGDHPYRRRGGYQPNQHRLVTQRVIRGGVQHNQYRFLTLTRRLSNPENRVQRAIRGYAQHHIVRLGIDPDYGDILYIRDDTESEEMSPRPPLEMVPRRGNSVSDLSQCSSDEETVEKNEEQPQ